MIRHPTSVELVDAVARFIEGVAPNLAGRDAFMARVSLNVLGVIKRELTLGPAAEAAAVRRMAALLGREGDFADLNEALCAALESGAMDADTPGLIAALKANLREQLAIDQPNYVADLP